MAAALFFSISFILLAVATYTDLRERIVSDKITYSMIALGLLLHLFLSFLTDDFGFILFSGIATIGTFLGAMLLWKLGVWAGGDVKLFTGLAALNPVNYGVLRDLIGLNGALFASIHLPVFPFWLFVFSVFAMFPYGAMISLNGIAKNKDLSEKVFAEIKKRFVHLAAFSILVAGLSAVVAAMRLDALFVLPMLLAIGFLRKKISAGVATVVFAFALYTDYVSALQGALMVFLPLLFLFLLLKLYFASREILAENVKITALEEGMISGETIVEEKGKVKRLEKAGIGTIIKHFRNNNVDAVRRLIWPSGRILASSRAAGGLTEEQIRELKKLVNEKKLENKLAVKKSVPFVPAVLIAYILLQLVGDLVWNFFL